MIPRARRFFRVALEDIVRIGGLSSIEIRWSGVHAALLTGKEPEWYEVVYDEGPPGPT
jgi:hypothetical protein